MVSDASAAGGARIWNPDAGATKRTTASANPSTYFEMSFNAVAGVPYRLWVRSKAQNNHWGNDSVFVQFSGSVTASGGAAYRIGTTSAAEVNLEECNGCGVSGWGWQDNGWGAGMMGPLIYFQASGSQSLRVQVREDGSSIDQIVLSPATYISSSPGTLRNDSTILPSSGCGWTATSNDSWIRITSGASGSGSGTVNYSVVSNTGTARTGTITVAGRTFTVNQSAGSTTCSFTITSTSSSFAAAGGNGNVGVSAGSGCGWTATSNDSWIRITSGASGSGNGSVGYSVSSNTSTSSRTGTMTVAGRTFTVTQAGAQGAVCSYTLSPTFATVGTLGGSGMVMVSVNNSSCTWQATSNASWITITSGSQGKGGLVAYTVARNTTGGIRQGTMTIAGKTFAVYQK
jgi:hypothetical protein